MGLLWAAIAPFSALSQEIRLYSGLRIVQSCKIQRDTYQLRPSPVDSFSLQQIKSVGQGSVFFTPVIQIIGNDLDIDFQQAVLIGSNHPERPDQFKGVAIFVQGKNIRLRNLHVHGYKIALFADAAESLLVESCNFSYNYRPKLRSTPQREDYADWLSYHQNNADEWLRYGSGIYLSRCLEAVVRNCIITGNQNALLMSYCQYALVYNNTFQFNSGLGIGLYRSSYNRIMHNQLDWNVRGYSHGIYQRGQDSAALLLYEQSSHNLIAFNSCTHSGDGLFLWAGQSTMDTGEGGCNDNVVFGNDFSFAPTNGVEITFSSNQIRGNYIEGCTYGIWGGYSYRTLITGNLIRACRTGIAIEHGQEDTIRQNLIEGDSTGIYLWARSQQPEDWGYAQKRDVRSRDILIDRNVFVDVRNPLKISNSDNVSVNGENLFYGFETLLETPRPNRKWVFWRNDLYAPTTVLAKTWRHPGLSPHQSLNFSHPDKQPANLYAPLMIPVAQLQEPDSLPDYRSSALSAGLPRGREHIIIGEWGPYNFRRPVALESATSLAAGEKRKQTLELVLLGPTGNWRLIRQTGVTHVDVQKGLLPTRINVQKAPDARHVLLEFEYTGTTDMLTEFGRPIPAGQAYRFRYESFTPAIRWNLDFYNYDDTMDPTADSEAFMRFLQGKPDAKMTSEELYFSWWDSPAEGIREDRFGVRASADITLDSGDYTISIGSDDGVRLYIDGRLAIDHWDIHEPFTDERTLRLGGRHRLDIYYFEAAGFGTLDFRIFKRG